MPTYNEIKEEFDNSLGYIRNDITAIRQGAATINYTVMLLIGCGCEMLAATLGDRKRRGERVFAELLPPGDWRLLADSIYTALRDGLAHGFDTKHLDVGGTLIQIQVSWSNANACEIIQTPKGPWLRIGVSPIATALIAKINEYEKLLQAPANEEARVLFKKSCDQQRTKPLNQHERAAWTRLMTAAGL